MKLRCSEQSRNNKILENIIYVLSAALLGGSFFAVLLNIFEFGWSTKVMFSGSIKGGFLSTVNAVADQFGSRKYIIMEKFADGYDDTGELFPNGLFMTTVLVILIVISYLIVRYCSKWFILLYIIPVIVLPIVIDKKPDYILLFIFAATLFICLIAMINKKVTSLMFILPAVIILISFGIVFSIRQNGIVDNSKVLGKITDKVKEAEESRYGKDPLKNGKLDELSAKELRKDRGSIDKVLSSLKGNKDESKTALSVEKDKMQSYYLKGFIGERFENNRWEKLDSRIHYENRDKLYWLNRSGFDGLSQLGNVKSILDNISPETMKIEVKSANRKNMFLPYEITGTDKSIYKGFENHSGAYLGTNKFLGKRNYNCQVEENLTSTWTKWVGKLYAKKVDKNISKYFINESHHNVFNYKNYTEYPETLAPAFEKEIGKTGDIRKNHVQYKIAIDRIRKYLKDKYIYTDYFTKSKGEDEITAFINSKKGSDAHFASLGTLLFRYHGIPARYAEGYLITPSDAKENKVDLGRSHNHAWTEIYIDGYGWVPIEVTPEYMGIMKEADLNVGLEAVSYDNKFNAKDKPEQKPSKEGESVKAKIRNILRLIWIMLGIIVTAALLIWALYKLIPVLWAVWKRYKDFNDRDPKEGTKAIFRYIKKKNLPVSEKTESLGNYAIYSLGRVAEADRKHMKDALKRGKYEKRKIKKINRTAGTNSVGSIIGRLRIKK